MNSSNATQQFNGGAAPEQLYLMYLPEMHARRVGEIGDAIRNLEAAHSRRTVPGQTRIAAGTLATQNAEVQMQHSAFLHEAGVELARDRAETVESITQAEIRLAQQERIRSAQQMVREAVDAKTRSAMIRPGTSVGNQYGQQAA